MSEQEGGDPVYVTNKVKFFAGDEVLIKADGEEGEFVGTLGKKDDGEDVEIYWFYKYDDILGPKFFLHEQELGKSMHYPDRIPGPSINGRVHVAQLDSAAESVSKQFLDNCDYFFRFTVAKSPSLRRRLYLNGAKGRCFCGLPDSLAPKGMVACVPRDQKRCPHVMHSQCARILQLGFHAAQIRSGLRTADSDAWIGKRLDTPLTKKELARLRPQGVAFGGEFMCPECAARHEAAGGRAGKGKGKGKGHARAGGGMSSSSKERADGAAAGAAAVAAAAASSPMLAAAAPRLRRSPRSASSAGSSAVSEGDGAGAGAAEGGLDPSDPGAWPSERTMRKAMLDELKVLRRIEAQKRNRDMQTGSKGEGRGRATAASSSAPVCAAEAPTERPSDASSAGPTPASSLPSGSSEESQTDALLFAGLQGDAANAARSRAPSQDPAAGGSAPSSSAAAVSSSSSASSAGAAHSSSSPPSSTPVDDTKALAALGVRMNPDESGAKELGEAIAKAQAKSQGAGAASKAGDAAALGSKRARGTTTPASTSTSTSTSTGSEQAEEEATAPAKRRRTDDNSNGSSRAQASKATSKSASKTSGQPPSRSAGLPSASSGEDRRVLGTGSLAYASNGSIPPLLPVAPPANSPAAGAGSADSTSTLGLLAETAFSRPMAQDATFPASSPQAEYQIAGTPASRLHGALPSSGHSPGAAPLQAFQVQAVGQQPVVHGAGVYAVSPTGAGTDYYTMQMPPSAGHGGGGIVYAAQGPFIHAYQQYGGGGVGVSPQVFMALQSMQPAQAAMGHVAPGGIGMPAMHQYAVMQAGQAVPQMGVSPWAQAQAGAGAGAGAGGHFVVQAQPQYHSVGQYPYSYQQPASAESVTGGTSMYGLAPNYGMASAQLPFSSDGGAQVFGSEDQAAKGASAKQDGTSDSGLPEIPST